MSNKCKTPGAHDAVEGVLADVWDRHTLDADGDGDYVELVGKCLDAFDAELERWHKLDPEYEWQCPAPMAAIVHAILHVIEEEKILNEGQAGAGQALCEYIVERTKDDTSQVICIECFDAGHIQPVSYRNGAWMCPRHYDRGHIDTEAKLWCKVNDRDRGKKG